ncbi:MAG: hypothetical protein COS88_06315 [Chloroflexi bacterium CG07_land_8_20_14_0_80_51_10]|nr:MAG: hypothetical protein COS88_06315 [Chloroflexi bacterium CG07_land_8_20_14_0_80_51_10]
MAEEIGKIEKPEAESFKGRRKIYLVPLLFAGPDAPAEYIEKLDRYWSQVGEHIVKLEASIGKVKRIFHELITQSGEDGLRVLEKLNQSSFQITSEKCRQGAVIEALDDKELADELMDWERFLMAGFVSQKVAGIVSEFYTEASKKRYEHMTKRIDETLQDGEASILFIREGHSVQFPSGIDVFSVSPPALDDIYRWVRDRASQGQGEQ